jgi:hypothetical protein
MRKLQQKTVASQSEIRINFFSQFAEGLELIPRNKNAIILNALKITLIQDKYMFYPLIGQILNLLGYNCLVTRDGDTNNRSDAYVIDREHSIPIEIKSPTEISYINNKSIRQAVENKIVLLSRGFYPTARNTTSLAIGYSYPAERSGVLDLIEDVNITYDFNIGIISLEDLLKNLWEMVINDIKFDKTRITFLKGPFQ